MSVQKTRMANNPLICICILLLCFATGIDDLSGFSQTFSKHAPLIQNAGNQGDEDEGRLKASPVSYASIDGIDSATDLSVSLVSLHVIECRTNLAYLESSHNRAPPSC
jgi:hypothetical protein